MEWFCPACELRVGPAGCTRCPRKNDRVDIVGAVTEFEGISREAVHALKYHERHAIASLLGDLMTQLAREVPADIVTHVPLHRSRRRERGYDQSAFLAKRVAKNLDLRNEQTLVRTRQTAQQALLQRDARRENVAGAFRASGVWQGESFLLIDDVMTTGATLGAAAETLRAAGAGFISGLVFAHAT